MAVHWPNQTADPEAHDGIHLAGKRTGFGRQIESNVFERVIRLCSCRCLIEPIPLLSACYVRLIAPQ